MTSTHASVRCSILVFTDIRDQADHGRPVEAMKVFVATVSQTNGRGPHCTAADQAGIEAPVLSLELDDPLEEEDEVWYTTMVEAVSTVMSTVEASNQALVEGPGQKQGSHNSVTSHKQVSDLFEGLILRSHPIGSKSKCNRVSQPPRRL